MTSKTPSEKGYRLPAEWEPHEATWISWPQPDCNSFPGSYERVIPTFVAMAEALAESEIVRINVMNSEQEKTVRSLLKSCPRERVEFFTFPPMSHGAVTTVRSFLTSTNAPHLAALNFGFNAWGYKLSPFDEDNAVPPPWLRHSVFLFSILGILFWRGDQSTATGLVQSLRPRAVF